MHDAHKIETLSPYDQNDFHTSATLLFKENYHDHASDLWIEEVFYDSYDMCANILEALGKTPDLLWWKNNSSIKSVLITPQDQG